MKGQRASDKIFCGAKSVLPKLKKSFFEIKLIIAKVLSRGAENGVYYVNGPKTLPPPLSKEEESRCIENLPFDDEARDKLIEHNLRLVVYIAKKFENTGVGIEDLVSIGTLGLIKGINTFRSDKNINSFLSGEAG